ncbi:probable 2-oxoglutarate-dependent dioxygenase AOP1 [Typha angustifolia]|uniref:probable 2-oxoglutarate-dependent dioxygenase AOP1 n=1 Tax=Typha angustifolia TaxID=59011 RepID=UPI003C2B0016
MSSQIPKIDFSDVDLSNPGTQLWNTVRGQVMDALTSMGCFEALYPSVTPELRDALFGSAVKDLFALPLETKLLNSYGPEKPFHGYLGNIPGLDNYESLAITDAPRPQEVRRFADLMWPDGNPSFCETALRFAEQFARLEEMVYRMVLESLGVFNYHAAQTESNWSLLRFSQYTAPNGEEKNLGYISHQDTNTLSIVCQNQVDGLEVQTKNGQWILVTPSQASLIVMAGNAFRAWTNGRVYAPFHRILVGGEVTRYSAIFFSIPGENLMIQAPEELVDEEHPSLFKPYDYNEFVNFCVSKESGGREDKLEAFCGVSATRLS